MTKKGTTMEYQKVIDYIFQMIKEGRLIVGSKIPSERDIAEKLGIGRNSTREAISILRGMGLVESKHGSGNYISKDSGRTIRCIVSVMLSLGSISMKDIMDYRRVMARSVMELIFKNGLDYEYKERLEKIVDEMKSASGNKLITLDEEFHITLIHATKNPLFISVMEAIAEVYHESVEKVMGESDGAATMKFVMLHAKILESIVKKDENACLKYITKHYDLAESKL